MATATDSSSPTNSASTWALPLAATILVAGSLAFWALAGVVWLATRPAPQPPIVVLVDRARPAEPVGNVHETAPVGNARSLPAGAGGVPQGGNTPTATPRNGTEAVPYNEELADATLR